MQQMDQEEIELIKAYIDKPESEDFYIKAFQEYTKGGVEQFKWVWSWWAFGGGVFFLLYRKLYIEALIFFVIGVIGASVPIAYVVIWIVSGALFPYLVFKRYQKGKEMTQGDKEALREFGGYNKWAIYLGVAISVLNLLGFLYTATLFISAGNNPLNVQ